MNKQELLKLQKLAEGVGQFIRYWGFRQIHGEVWAVVYLAPAPLSGTEIGKILQVSKALMSPALKELVAEGLIHQTNSENSKTKRYIAEEDVTKVIHEVLKRREKPMIEKIQERHSELGLLNTNSEVVNSDRFQKMGMMILMAQLGLGTLLDSNQVWGE
jgi:DNA-binding transcriptional regulator GbsR (MarR family)